MFTCIKVCSGLVSNEEEIEKRDSAIFSDDYITFGDLSNDFVTYFSKKMGSNNITVDKICLDNGTFCFNPETINLVRIMDCYNKHNQRKVSRKR